jgi:signal transduction histidine kinase
MTTIHRKSLDSDRLGSYVQTTNGFVRESLAILENRPKTRLLLTKRFWKTALLIFTFVLLLASYSVYQLLIIHNRNSEDLRRLNGISATASELLAGTLAINSILTEVRFSSSNVQPNQIKSLQEEINFDLARLETFAFELQDREIKQIVDSLALTVKSWEMVLADLSNSDLDRGLEIAEVELIGAVARSTELLESQLHLRIESEEVKNNNQLRSAVIFGVVSLLFAIFSTLLLVPIAIAGSIERLVVMQKANRDREQRLEVATSTFLDNVNLELRTPLTSISGFSELLSNADDSINQSQQRRMIRTIYKNSQKLNELVDNVLTMCRIQTHEVRFKVTEFDAREVLRAEVGR